MKKKSVAILGSTGSVGRAAVKMLAYHEDKFVVEYLVAHENYELLATQARLLKPKFIVINNPLYLAKLVELLQGFKCEILAGAVGVEYVCGIKCDIVISAIVGAAGLLPTFNAIKAGSNIALANKESLVCAGSILISAAQKRGVDLIPIDSEHNGVMQILFNKKEVSKIILTASGGPFRGFSQDALSKVTKEDALKHPTWVMGNKITIDSATLFNKGFELIEASYLFDVGRDKLDVVVHPQSIIHAMVQYKDGSLLAQMSDASMEIPLHIAMFWPDRKSYNAKMLDLTEIAKLEFYSPDRKIFRSLDIIDHVIKVGGNAGAIVNAANEVAVAGFLNGQISFIAIYDIVEEILATNNIESVRNIEEILDCDITIRAKASEIIKKQKVSL